MWWQLVLLIVVGLVGVSGWGVAWSSIRRQRAHQCPVPPPPIIEQPTKAVLLNSVGLPESCRAIKGYPPETYSRPHGSGPATIYTRQAIAVVYQATTPRQQQQ